MASRLMAEENRFDPLTSFPSTPSTVTLFQWRRWPPMLGTCDPKLSPIASMSSS